MDREQARLTAKSKLADYLATTRNIRPGKPFRCINPAHPDHKPSMSLFRNVCICFACNARYDIFDVISIDYNLPRGSREMFEKTYEVLGIYIEDSKKKESPFTGKKRIPEKRKRQDFVPQLESEISDFTSYLEKCAARAGQTDYFHRRGIDNSIIAKFGLGYDPSYSRGTGGSIWKAAIIPTGKNSYVVRNTDDQAISENRYRKAGKAKIFNARALETEGPLFVAEGEIDALSFETAGFRAVGLGSIAQIGTFLRLVEEQRPRCMFLIALDDDKAGERATKELIEGLEKLGMQYFDCSKRLYGGAKDANEALLKDRTAFESSARACIEASVRGDIEQEAEVKTEYIRKVSASGFLDDFLDDIHAGTDTPCIPMGFARTDRMLDGGVIESLIVVAGSSAVGKTSFCMQIADKMAESGHDVLIFSLEMSRRELIARSISRETFLVAARGGKAKLAMAKTARQLTTLSSYSGYDDDELDLINTAIQQFHAYSERLFYFEGVGSIGVEEIRSTVEKHIRITGHDRPVIMVDYLQVLAAPFSNPNRGISDKQNVDHAVLELKRLSRDLKCPVFCISSRNRASYGEEISFASLRESSAIEYTADVIFGLEYQGVTGKNFVLRQAMEDNPRHLEVLCLKNRQGQAGWRVPFDYFPQFNFFRER